MAGHWVARGYGNFGAIGAAWIFSKETFVANILKFLSLGKIRASVGRTGNDQMANYQYLSTYGGDGAAYSGTNGLFPSKLTNPYYGWETINKAEVALELGFFNDRLQTNVNFFRNRTKNQ
ncbi:MAG: TonB-dependent receptor, partial [Hyphomicrobiales bacterium]